MLLNMRASVTRKKRNSSGGYVDTQIFKDIHCEILPISSLDQVVAYARESSHVIWVSHWIFLRKEDRIIYGRQLADPELDVLLPFIYVVNGIRTFEAGIPQRAYYAREMD